MTTQQNNGAIRNRKHLIKKVNQPKIQQEIIKKLSEPVITEEVKLPIQQEEQKLFGVIAPELVENLSDSNSTSKRIQTIEEISLILTKKLNLQHIQEELDQFINFIIKYINDSNENVAAVAIQILNKVLSTVNLSKQFEPKRLVPLLIKKYAEKSKRVRIETTEAFKHLLKIFRIKRFNELLLPYLQYPHFNIKQEIMNLMIYSFINSKGAANFDHISAIKALSQLLNDKSLKVRFIALEGITYLTTIESSEKILKIVQQEMVNNKNIVKAVKKRFKLFTRVKFNSDNQVEYPSLEDNEEILQILRQMDDDHIDLNERFNNQTTNNFQRSQRISLKESLNQNYFSSQIKFGSKMSTPKESLTTQKSTPNFSSTLSKIQEKSQRDTPKTLILPKLVESEKDKDEDESPNAGGQSSQRSLAQALKQIKRQSKTKNISTLLKSQDELDSQFSRFQRTQKLGSISGILNNRNSISSTVQGFKTLQSQKSPSRYI
eukprot:403372533